MKKSIIIILLFSPCFVFAKNSLEFRQEGSAVTFQGICDSNSVNVELFGKANDQNATKKINIDCKDGKFSQVIDFSKADLPEGNYVVGLDGEKSQNVVSVMKKDNSAKKEMLAEQKKQQETKPESADLKFLNAFAVFQQSILDMRTWLAETKYPSWAKSGIDGTLDGVEKLAGRIGEMLFSADNPQSETAENVVPEGQDLNTVTQVGNNLDVVNDENQSSNSEVINN